MLPATCSPDCIATGASWGSDRPSPAPSAGTMWAEASGLGPDIARAIDEASAVGSLIAGAVVVESVFAWPGVGRLLVVAVANRDLAVVQCILLLVAMTMVTSNLIVDFLYGFLDPRLRARGAHA
jgi:hypothetical protein